MPMEKSKKYALLDTDFIYKCHLARNAENRTLAEQEYYKQLSAFLKNQTDYKVWSLSGHQRIKVPIMQVLDDIYDKKFQLLRNGDLQYIK